MSVTDGGFLCYIAKAASNPVSTPLRNRERNFFVETAGVADDWLEMSIRLNMHPNLPVTSVTNQVNRKLADRSM